LSIHFDSDNLIFHSEFLGIKADGHLNKEADRIILHSRLVWNLNLYHNNSAEYVINVSLSTIYHHT